MERYLVDALREAGHEVHAVAEVMAGSADEAVLALAVREHAVLITADKDFGELVFQRRAVPAGVLLLRLVGLPQREKIARLLRAVREHGAELPCAFAVLTTRALRFRRFLD